MLVNRLPKIYLKQWARPFRVHSTVSKTDKYKYAHLPVGEQIHSIWMTSQCLYYWQGRSHAAPQWSADIKMRSENMLLPPSVGPPLLHIESHEISTTIKANCIWKI